MDYQTRFKTAVKTRTKFVDTDGTEWIPIKAAGRWVFSTEHYEMWAYAQEAAESAVKVFESYIKADIDSHWNKLLGEA